MESTTITTMGTEPRICPNVPVTKSRGAKAAMVVSTPMVTGPKTPRTPLSVEAAPGPPFSCSVMMFSPTTTASSTTIPSTMIRANSEIMLMLTPKGAKKSKAPRKEIGTPMATHVARRKSSMMTKNRNTMAKPSTPLRTRRLKRCCNMSVWSSHISTDVPGGGS